MPAVEAGDVVWRIYGDTTDLNRALGNIERNMNQSFATITRNAGLAMTALGATITGVFGKAASDAATFGKGVANLATLGVEDLQALEEGTRDLAVEFGVDLSDAIAATYEALSAGIPEDAALMVMEQAARGAQAGVGSLGDALDLGTSVLNAWNIKGATAVETTATMEKIMGMAAVAAFKGKTTFADMATSIGQVAPVTAAAGVSIEEFFAALAGLTASGLPTASAMAQLQQMISNTIKPSSEAAKLADKLGLEFNAEALAAKGLSGFLDSVQQATGGNVNQMGILFGSVEALGAALALTGTQSGLFKETLGEMGNATQTLAEMQQAFIDNNPALAFEQVKVAMQSLSVEVGQYLLPAMIETARWMNEIIKATIDWLQKNPELATQILTLAKNIGYALMVIGPLVVALPILTGILGALTWPAIAVGAAIFALVAIFAAVAVAVYEWATAWAAIPENMEKLNTFLGAAGEAISGIWQGIVGIFRAAVDAIKGAFTDLSGSVNFSWSSIVAVFVQAGEWITGVLGWLAEGVGMAFDWIGGILAGAIEWTWANWDQLVQIFQNAITGIMLICGLLWEGLKLGFQLLWNILSAVFGQIMEGWAEIAGVAGDESKTWLDVVQIMQEKTIAFLTVLSDGLNRFVGFVNWAWPAIAMAANIGANLFIEPIMWMVGRFQWAVDYITWAMGKLVGAWDWLTGAGLAGGDMQITGPVGLATGGTVEQAGWALVGERGPELVNLPAGSTVYDAQQTAQARGGASGGSQTVNITNHFGRDSVRSDDDIRRIEQAITDNVAARLRSAGAFA